ncbi:MAG: isochorismatase family protein [Candidatus Rokubacteria bacterium]|nr:isochorismatase family protein [Candidatus Rokubacteria bacterium]
MGTRKLADLARVIRSKNAGPFEITLDLIFSDRETYERVRRTGYFTRERVASLYRIPPEAVHDVVFYDPALALKLTIARQTAQGSVGERDTYGAQQHAPLLEVDLPWDDARDSPGAGDYAHQFNPPFRLDPARVALVVVDMQYASAARDHGLGRVLRDRGQEALGHYRFARIETLVVPTIRALLDFFRRRRLRIVYLTVGSELPDYGDLLPHMRAFAESAGNTRGRHEHAILDALAPLPGEPVINKTTMSAFHSSGLERLLRAWNVEHLVFAGVSTNSCVEGTARDAADRGYRCVLVEDGCAAASQRLHDATGENFQRLLGRVAPAATVMRELEGLPESSPRPGSDERGSGGAPHPARRT